MKLDWFIGNQSNWINWKQIENWMELIELAAIDVKFISFGLLAAAN